MKCRKVSDRNFKQKIEKNKNILHQNKISVIRPTVKLIPNMPTSEDIVLGKVQKIIISMIQL